MASGTAYPQNSNPLGLGGIGGLIPSLFQSANMITQPGFPNNDTGNRYSPGFPDENGDGHDDRIPLPGSKFPDNTLRGPNFPSIHPMPDMPLPSPDYQTQFNSFSDTLGGFGKQMGGFGEQMGGFDKQFGGIMDRLSKIEEGIAGLMPQAAGTGAVAAVPYGNNTNQGGIGSIYTGTNSRGY
jgi:hypothetical protein|tara:strand:- start:892 stop:1437 length:546 start_codon:yes stop_codon:yes gene_type:complete